MSENDQAVLSPRVIPTNMSGSIPLDTLPALNLQAVHGMHTLQALPREMRPNTHMVPISRELQRQS